MAGQVQRFGRGHPIIRTQFFSEELDTECGMFSSHQQALMQGDHLARPGPEEGKLYAMLLDVGGEQTAPAGDRLISQRANLANPLAAGNENRRDSTALTVVEIDLSSLEDEGLQAPTYRVVQRRLWTGVSQSLLYGQIRALVQHWQARRLVIDATGIGAGLASFLGRALGTERVIPYLFNLRSKSDLGWGFLAVVETGRYKEYRASDLNPPDQNHLQEIFWQQVRACRSQVMAGPGQLLRWGTPETAQEHDDLLISAALCTVLDGLAWSTAKSTILPPVDPLAGMRRVY